MIYSGVPGGQKISDYQNKHVSQKQKSGQLQSFPATLNTKLKTKNNRLKQTSIQIALSQTATYFDPDTFWHQTYLDPGHTWILDAFESWTLLNLMKSWHFTFFCHNYNFEPRLFESYDLNKIAKLSFFQRG